MISEGGISHPIVIKMGGSIITFKDKPYTPNLNAIRKIAKILSQTIEEGGQLILVHGGGSYGHYAVTEANQRKGILDQLDVARVQHKMLELSQLITEIFLDEGLPVSVHPAHTLCRNLKDCCFNVIIEDISNGLVPMTYGDIIYTERGYKIISGDDLALLIASTVGSRKVLFVMSEPGLLDKEGKVIKRLTPTRLEDVHYGDSSGFDVTGGIKRKVQSALDFVMNHDIEIRMLDIDGLEKVLKGGEAGSLVSR